MRAVSQQFKDALNVSHKKVSEVTVTPPGGETTNLQFTAGSVTSSNDTGVRYSASLEVVPQPGVDLYSILSTPGAIYTIRTGIDFGAGDPELVDLGVYEASQGGINIIDGTIGISLVDRWVAIEGARSAEPTEVDGGLFSSRAQIIQLAVDGAFFGFSPEFQILNDGGPFTDVRVWERERTELVLDLARDGQLDVYFDAAGVFVMRTQPIVDVTNTVWTFRTGDIGNILTADRERPFDRLYNVVVVSPIDEEQTWSTQIVEIADTTHPRYPANMGRTVPYFFSSPTLGTNTEAREAGETILQRVLGTTETVSLGTLGNPALEVGDCVTIAHEATPSDPGFSAVHMIDGFTYDLAAGLMTLNTRSSSLADLAEA